MLLRGAYMHHMNWDDLKLFHAVVQCGSMRAAANALKISHSTISRRIDTLEKTVGTPLLLRLSDGHKVTDAGRYLMNIASSLRNDLDSFGLHVASSETELCGVITLTMPDTLALSGLMPILSDFSDEHPAIHLEIVDTTEIVDLNRRVADIAFRFTNAPDESLIGRKLATAYIAAYTSAEYASIHAPLNETSNAEWICGVDQAEQTNWLKSSPFPNLKIGHTIATPAIRKEALRTGMGIGMMPCALMKDDDDFVMVSNPEPFLDLWMLSHRDFRNTERMRTFRQYIFSRKEDLSELLGPPLPLQPEGERIAFV